MTPKLKKIIVILGSVIILFVIYAIFIKPSPQTETLVTGRGPSTDIAQNGDAQVLGSQISQALLKIEQITLDRTIFTNQVYQSLVDRSQPIIDEPVGRSNPFAPLGETSLSVATTSIRATSTATSTPIRATSTQVTNPN